MSIARYRSETAGLIARLRAHCEQIGINPPDRALRRYASLRYIEAHWWLASSVTADRLELLETLAFRLRLDRLERGTPLCGPDLANCVRGLVADSVLAAWPDAPLMDSLRDL